MIQITDVTGLRGGECYLLTTRYSALLWDTGMGIGAKQTAQKIAQSLHGRSLDLILLSHTHYDHILGLPMIKAQYPDAKVVASALAATILDKESARKAMLGMQAEVAEKLGIEAPLGDELSIDIIAEHGQRIQLQDLTIQTLNAPGHTRCSMDFYFEECGLLAASESNGTLVGNGRVVPGVVVSYRQTLNTIRQSRALQPRQLLFAHYGPWTSGSMERLLEQQQQAVEEVAAFVADAHRRGMEDEEIVQSYKDQFYLEAQAILQPEHAFLANARAMVPRLIQELSDSPQ